MPSIWRHVSKTCTSNLSDLNAYSGIKNCRKSHSSNTHSVSLFHYSFGAPKYVLIKTTSKNVRPNDYGLFFRPFHSFVRSLQLFNFKFLIFPMYANKKSNKIDIQLEWMTQWSPLVKYHHLNGASSIAATVQIVDVSLCGNKKIIFLLRYFFRP